MVSITAVARHRYCHRENCTRQRRSKSKFCARHGKEGDVPTTNLNGPRPRDENGRFATVSIASGVKKSRRSRGATRKQKVVIPNTKESPFLFQGNYSDNKHFGKTVDAVRCRLAKEGRKNKNTTQTGSRRTYIMTSRDKFMCDVENFCREVTKDIIEKNSNIPEFEYLVRDGDFYCYRPAIVNAPRYNKWLLDNNRNGKKHRDNEDIDDLDSKSGVLAAMVNIDIVTEDNGAVRFYPNSESLPIESQQSISRILRKARYTDLTGEIGDVTIWDAETIHYSLPNKSNKDRATLHWYIVPIDIQMQDTM